MRAQPSERRAGRTPAGRVDSRVNRPAKRLPMAQMTATGRDARHLQRTIELAARARGHTSPNPLVGAVVVKGDRTIGEGWHAGAGLPHAEREALDACSESTAGATLYVSLEPCAHHGRT